MQPAVTANVGDSRTNDFGGTYRARNPRDFFTNRSQGRSTLFWKVSHRTVKRYPLFFPGSHI